MTSCSDGGPTPLQINAEDALPSPLDGSEIEKLLRLLINLCISLESVTFQLTLRDQQTGQETLNERGCLPKLLGELPECLSRLWNWNEVLIIEACDPARDEGLDSMGDSPSTMIPKAAVDE
jgi:hypothetical protein